MAVGKKKSTRRVIPKKVDPAPAVAAASDPQQASVSVPTEPETSKEVPQQDALPVEVVVEENTQEEKLQETEDIVNDEVFDEGEGKRVLFKKIALWSGIAIVIGALLGISWKLAYERGVVVGQQQVKETQQKEAAVQEKIVTPTPDEISKGKYTIEVLNGSGISGEAARVKGILEKEGFTVSSTGNADKSDLEETTIQTKSSVAKEWIDLLKTALGTSVVVSEPTSLDDTESADVIVTVGSKKVE